MTAPVPLVERLAEVLWEKFGAEDHSPLAAWLTHQDCRRMAHALLPVVEQAVTEADSAARLSEMQGKADSLTGQLIKAAAWDEGHRLTRPHSDYCEPTCPNPYRADAIGTTETGEKGPERGATGARSAEQPSGVVLGDNEGETP